MSEPGTRVSLSLIALMVVAAGSAAAVQQPSEPVQEAENEVGWHQVQPGETLEGITAKYLGSSEHWRENWDLNPEIADPHVLVPGQRIRVLLTRNAPSAEITALAKDVDEKPYPRPWMPARLGDRLKERDGVRTREQSSAELSFDDGSRLVVSEQSVVFLRDVGRSVEDVSRSSVEIVSGQADVGRRPAEPVATDIEIIVGDARASARPSAGEESLARARKTDVGAAQVMVFKGSGDVAARGLSVELPAGTGTFVAEGQPPSPPEKLLPPPSPWRPIPEKQLDHANPKLSWDPVDGAASYTVEICRDLGCGELAYRIAGITELSAVPDGLPLGRLYWTVRAVSDSGLDGFPSEPRSFDVRSFWRKPHPAKRQ